jgi:hypothetical protein
MSTEKTGKKRPRGRPPLKNPATKSLAGVRVTQEQVDSYHAAADREDKPMSAWVRDTLDKAAV